MKYAAYRNQYKTVLPKLYLSADEFKHLTSPKEVHIKVEGDGLVLQPMDKPEPNKRGCRVLHKPGRRYKEIHIPLDTAKKCGLNTATRAHDIPSRYIRSGGRRELGLDLSDIKALAPIPDKISSNGLDQEVELTPVKEVSNTMSHVPVKAVVAIARELDECFDPEKGTFVRGHSDKTVADKLGLSENIVSRIREESFGPLKQPALDEETKRWLTQEISALKKVQDEILDSLAEADKRYGRIKEQVDKLLKQH